MISTFLLEETTVHENGDGPVSPLPSPRPAALLITLGITHIIEQESLTLSIQGSVDGVEWNPTPLAGWSQKCYTGGGTLLIDLKAHPDIGFVRSHWKVNRWGRGDKKTAFTFYLFAEEA